MKKKELEILLQKVPMAKKPIPTLEQYMTPAPIAADILYTAYHQGDILDKTVADLGCGTGTFAIGAYLLGAKQSIGIDSDEEIIKSAQTYAQQQGYDVLWHHLDVNDFQTPCDTIIMNPPFGAQKANRHSDQEFLKVAMNNAAIVYSLHMKQTLPFLNKFVRQQGGEISWSQPYHFPIKGMFSFHQKLTKDIDVELLRIQVKKEDTFKKD